MRILRRQQKKKEGIIEEELEEIDSALTKKIPDTKTCCRNKHLNSNASYYTSSDKKSRPIC